MKNSTQARDAQLIKRARLRVLARLFLYDLSVAQVSRRTGWSIDKLYRLKKTPLFREVFEEETEQLLKDTGVHHRVAHKLAARGLIKTIRKLSKMLDSRDPHVVFAAADRIARLNGSYLERVRVEGDGTPLSQSNVQVFNVSPEAREHARKFLELTRKKDGSYGPNGSNGEDS
jgi:hypothetical protein